MDILKYVDIMIGLAVVMVLLSPVVTSVTQFGLWFCRRRSEYLIEGLQNLILHLEGQPGATDGRRKSVPPLMTPERARRIARTILSSPVIAKGPALPPPLSWLPPFRNRCGECIEREELIRLLLELAAEGAAEA